METASCQQTRFRWSPSSTSILLGGWVALLLLARNPGFRFDYWTTSITLLYTAGVIGLVYLGRLATSRDSSAIAAVGFLAWAVLGSALSSSPALSLNGAVERELSAAIVVAAFGCWALCRNYARDVALCISVILPICIALHAAVATIQTLGFNSSWTYEFPGRATGLMTNPVYFGGLMAGAVGYGMKSAVDSVHRPHWTILICFCGGYGVMLSGSRVALASVLIISTWILVKSGRSAAVYGLATAVGASAGVLLARLSSTRDSVRRFQLDGSDGRIDVWKFGWSALWDRPFLGRGLGQFREGVQGHFTDEFARLNLSYGSQPWAEPHNIIVNLAVCTGVIGICFLAIFAWFEVRRVSGPLAVLAVAIMITWLMQPASLTLIPLTMAALGASGTCPEREPVKKRPAEQWRVGAAVSVSLVVGAYVVAGDFVSKSIDGTRSTAATVRFFYSADPNVEELLAQAFESSGDAHGTTVALERAVRYEPTRPVRWTRLAMNDLGQGGLQAAEAAALHAVTLQPSDLEGWLAVSAIARSNQDRTLLFKAQQRICDLLKECESPDPSGSTLD